VPGRTTISSVACFVCAINLLSAESTQLEPVRDLSSKDEKIVGRAIDSIETKPEKLDDVVLNAIPSYWNEIS
jgi:hypothetical protein